jgi:hypothetical protein
MLDKWSATEPHPQPQLYIIYDILRCRWLRLVLLILVPSVPAQYLINNGYPINLGTSEARVDVGVEWRWN